MKAVECDILERPLTHFFIPQATKNWDNQYQALAGMWAAETPYCWCHVTGPSTLEGTPGAAVRT